MKLLGKVRRLYHWGRLTLSEIERRTSLTHKTIRNWLKAPEGTEPKYRRQVGKSKIAPYAERLLKMLEIDARRPKRERRTALKLYAELRGLGCEGDYSRVTEFIRRWRINGGAAVVKAFVPLQFEPGEAHQFDWSEEHIVIGGVYRKILLAHLKLCFSRAFVVQAYPTQSHEMLFDAHTPVFTALGGTPRRGIYENAVSVEATRNESTLWHGLSKAITYPTVRNFRATSVSANLATTASNKLRLKLAIN